jgi:hypothetical protein
MDPIQFASEEDMSQITVQTKPELKFDGFVRYTVGGVEVGTLSATFDFSKLPPELHTDAVQFLARAGYRMEIGPVAHLHWPDRFEEPRPLLNIPSLWEKFLGWWRG